MSQNGKHSFLLILLAPYHTENKKEIGQDGNHIALIVPSHIENMKAIGQDGKHITLLAPCHIYLLVLFFFAKYLKALNLSQRTIFLYNSINSPMNTC